MEGINLEHGEYGLRAVITSPWRSEFGKYLATNGIRELELNDGKGWRGSDLSFLTDLPHLSSFKIIDLEIRSVEPIHVLHELLALEVITYCNTAITFSAFPLLQECSLEWRSGATSLFEVRTLKKLFLDDYKGRDVNAFARLTELESLAILNAPVENLFGLSDLTKLKSLRLANLKCLRSLAGIEPLVNLEELDIHTCPRIGSIDQVGYLSRLRTFHLNNDGNIESLKPLAKLTQLESVLFYESTNIVDGDLSPLFGQQHLTNISFRNRRHYSHSREEFGAAYYK